MTDKIATHVAAALGTRNQSGMSTAEYAVGTVSACGFAGILYKILTSDFGEGLLQSILDNVIGLLPF